MENMEKQGKRLNKYIADSGYCSRREADRLIEEGRVKVDGRTGVLGDRILEGMSVVCDGHELSGSNKKVYIALNRVWQNGPFKHALLGEQTASIPASLLQRCENVTYCGIAEVMDGII